MTKRISFTMLALLAFLLFDVRSASQHAAQPQAPVPEFVSDEVIVKFRQGTDEFTKDMARFRVSGTRKKLFRYIPGLEVIKLRRGVSVEEAINLYQQDPNVLYAEPNYILKTTLTPDDPRYETGELWGLNNFGQSGGTPDADIDAPEAWSHATGDSDVIVAIIDSGIDYNHPDLSANMFRNEADCNTNGIDDDGNGYVNDCYGIDTHNNDSNPMDDNNHGTHVAGTIGAKGNNDLGVVGINWNVKMMACKFVNSSGSGTTESAIDCLEYVKTMKDRGFNIIATSNSWGGGDFSQALYDAIDAQRQRGILFITAAGNGDFFGFPINNDQTPFYPCTYYLPNIVCVAATTRTDARSSFSNFGRRTVHIGAPGSDILSTTRNGNYGFSSGTSMATPHVTGVAALLKAEDPNRDWKAIKNLILAGGDNVSSMSDITITQKRLNANGALTCNNSIVLSRLDPINSAIVGSVGESIGLDILHINCANPNGNITLTVNPINENIVLVDNGSGSDQVAGDGIYSGEWTPSSLGTFTIDVPGDESVIVTVADVESIIPNPIDLAAPPANFTITGGGFADLGFGLPVVNFYASSTSTTVIAQARATSGDGTTLTVPYPTDATSVSGPKPGLSTGTLTVKVFNQTSATPTWSLLGSTTLTVNDTRPPPGVDSITPNPIDLAAPPASFTITGGGFADLGYGLPVANFYDSSGSVIAQARATSGDGTTLTVPYPTNTTSVSGPKPGLSTGTITVKVFNQTSATPTWSLVGSTTLTVNDTRPAPGVDSITPNPIELASPPANFTITGGGFADLGFGLPVVNFYASSTSTTAIAQARATSGNGTTLTVPYPTDATSISGPKPGLSAGTLTVKVFNQTGSNKWSLVGSTTLTVNDTTPSPGVSSITPNPIDLASPPASFTITGGGFADFGFGLPVVNFYASSTSTTVIAQARATSGNSTSLTVPYPTDATSISGPKPGLSAGTLTVKVFNQTGSNKWSLVGSTTLTVNDTTPSPGVSSITPNPIDLSAPPLSFTITGGGFADLGFGLPVINFYASSTSTTVIAQARATSGNSTTLTVPYPTDATSISGPKPGLSAGTLTVKVFNQIKKNNGWSLVGSTTLMVTDSQLTARRRN
jgi:subtilisin family serine protease